jgi:excisionase family DNA binding protein
MTTAVTSELLTRPEAAEYVHIKPQTLAVWACAGRGPTYVKVGRSVRYRVADLDAFLERGTVTPGESNS